MPTARQKRHSTNCDSVADNRVQAPYTVIDLKFSQETRELTSHRENLQIFVHFPPATMRLRKLSLVIYTQTLRPRPPEVNNSKELEVARVLISRILALNAATSPLARILIDKNKFFKWKKKISLYNAFLQREITHSTLIYFRSIP